MVSLHQWRGKSSGKFMCSSVETSLIYRDFFVSHGTYLRALVPNCKTTQPQRHRDDLRRCHSFVGHVFKLLLQVVPNHMCIYIANVDKLQSHEESKDRFGNSSACGHMLHRIPNLVILRCNWKL